MHIDILNTIPFCNDHMSFSKDQGIACNNFDVWKIFFLIYFTLAFLADKHFFSDIHGYFIYNIFFVMPTQISAETRIYKMWLFGIFQIKKKKSFNSKHFEIIKSWYIWANFLVLKPNIFRFSTRYFGFFGFPSRKQFCDFKYWCLLRYPFWFTSSLHSLQAKYLQQFTRILF